MTFDLNGNMTSDGTNSFAWDAENRMIRITYPGSNNFSTFFYDGLSRNVSIVETTAGSITSTKQFVWVGSNRKEERDASGALTKKFFDNGRMITITKYFYALDHLGSVREITDNSGAVQAQYAVDPFGRIVKLSENVAADFGYAGYYLHTRSGLNVTSSRLYSSVLGRFISRDPVEELSGSNLYAYVNNTPAVLIDPSGNGPLTQTVGQILSRVGTALSRFASRFSKNPAVETCCEEAESVAPFVRDLTLEDLGLKLTGPLKEITGTVTLSGEALNVRINMINGKFESLRTIVPSLTRLARCNGAKILNISGTIANEDLFDLVKSRYPQLTSGQGSESISIFLTDK